MYKIEKKKYGFMLTFGGKIDANEMEKWFMDSRRVLADQTDPFLVFVDMRTLIPIDYDARQSMLKGQRFYKEKGMERSVVILNSPITTMQFKGIAHETGIYEWERYIDASTEPDWEKVGLDWIINSIDPDKKKEAVSG